MWGKALPLGRAAGIELRLDLSWFLIAALLTWSLSQGYLPQLVPGAGALTVALAAFVAVIALFGSILLHELGHAVVAKAHGMQVRTITLFVFGGVAELGSEPPDAPTELRVAIAGPLVSLGLSGLAYALWRVATALDAGDLLIAVLGYLALANLVLAVFNLLPAFPLDGGRVLRAWLWHKIGNMDEATRRAAQVSSWIAGGLIALGLLGLLSGGGIGGLWPALLGLFVLAASQAARARVDVAEALSDHRVVELMRHDPVSITPDLSLACVVEDVMLRHGLSFLPVVEDRHLLGTLDLATIRGIDRDLWATTRVDDVFSPADGAVVDPGDPADRVFERMTQGGPRKVVVARGGKLLGVLTLSDLIESIRVQKEVKALAGG